MTFNPLVNELAAEHFGDLPQQVVDHRSRSVRPARRRTRASRLTVRVRPVRPGDGPLLADIFARLGPASRFTRFLTPKRDLTTAELRYFTQVDHHDHEALIATNRSAAHLLAKAGTVTHVIRDGTTLTHRVALPAPIHRPRRNPRVTLPPVGRDARSRGSVRTRASKPRFGRPSTALEPLGGC